MITTKLDSYKDDGRGCVAQPLRFQARGLGARGILRPAVQANPGVIIGGATARTLAAMPRPVPVQRPADAMDEIVPVMPSESSSGSSNTGGSSSQHGARAPLATVAGGPLLEGDQVCAAQRYGFRLQRLVRQVGIA